MIVVNGGPPVISKHDEDRGESIKESVEIRIRKLSVNRVRIAFRIKPNLIAKQLHTKKRVCDHEYK